MHIEKITTVYFSKLEKKRVFVLERVWEELMSKSETRTKESMYRRAVILQQRNTGPNKGLWGGKGRGEVLRREKLLDLVLDRKWKLRKTEEWRMTARCPPSDTLDATGISSNWGERRREAYCGGKDYELRFGQVEVGMPMEHLSWYI